MIKTIQIYNTSIITNIEFEFYSKRESEHAVCQLRSFQLNERKKSLSILRCLLELFNTVSLNAQFIFIADSCFFFFFFSLVWSLLNWPVCKKNNNKVITSSTLLHRGVTASACVCVCGCRIRARGGGSMTQYLPGRAFIQNLLCPSGDSSQYWTVMCVGSELCSLIHTSDLRSWLIPWYLGRNVLICL